MRVVTVPLLVLGAASAGFAAALSLAHQGFPVHVLDRDPRARPDPAVTALTPGAARELADLGLLERVAAGAREPSRVVHADATSGTVLRVSELGPAVRARFGHPYLLVNRTALRALLNEACDADEMITIEYERVVRSVEDVGDAVIVVTEDGTSYRAEALVGADGPFSRVRGPLGGGLPASQAYLMRRGPGPATESDEVRVWSSPSLWVTHAPAPGGGSDISVTVRIDEYEGLAHETSDELIGRQLARATAEVRRVTSGVVRGVATHVQRHHAPLDRWARHRMTVIGCAAQPMLPHTAQATSLMLMDAAALGAAFDQADGRIAVALESYAKARAGLRAAVAEHALDFATLCHADGLLRRTRDRLWRVSPMDSLAAIVGPMAPGGPIPTDAVRRQGQDAEV